MVPPRLIGFLRQMTHPTQIIHELVSRDRKDGLATRQQQGPAAEAYLNSTSQGAGFEDARKDTHIRGRSNRLVNYPG
jgi:hypothetical protein